MAFARSYFTQEQDAVLSVYSAGLEMLWPQTERAENVWELHDNRFMDCLWIVADHVI